MTAFVLYLIKISRNVQFRRSAEAKQISRILMLAYSLEIIIYSIYYFIDTSVYYDPFILQIDSPPVIIIATVQVLLLAIFIGKVCMDRQFRRSRRAKWIMMAFMLMYISQLFFSVVTSLDNPSTKISVYYQEDQIDPEKASFWLELAIGEDDGFDDLGFREQVTLLANPALKAISELTENKTPDFKPCGVAWFGEKEQALHWKYVQKGVDNCSLFGVCGSALTLVDTILGREEVEQAADPAGEILSDSDSDLDTEKAWYDNLSVSWKQVTICGLTIYAGYSMYMGEMPLPSQVRNVFESWKGVFKSALEQQVYSRFKINKK